MTRITRLFGIAALLLGLCSLSLFAQTQPASPDQTSPVQSSPAQSPSAQSQSQPASQQPQTFNGTLVQGADGLSLKDSATGTSYRVDNEDQLKQYVGKNVKITGTLDPSTNTIHVTGVDMGAR